MSSITMIAAAGGVRQRKSCVWTVSSPGGPRKLWPNTLIFAPESSYRVTPPTSQPHANVLEILATARPVTQCRHGQVWAATEMPMLETEKKPRYQILRRLRAAVARLGLTNYDRQATKTNATHHGAAVGSAHPHGPTGFRSPWSGVLTGRA